MYAKERMLSKLHNGVVTGANLDYEGSVTIGRDLLRLTYMEPGDRVQVLNITNGNRIETYVIEGENREICLNGAAAHQFSKGDRVIIIQYGLEMMGVQKAAIGEYRMTNDFPAARIVILDGTENNGIKDVH